MSESTPQEASDSIRKCLHDISGELFLIRGYAELAGNEIDADSGIQTHLRNIQARVDAVSNQLEQIRAISEKDASTGPE